MAHSPLGAPSHATPLYGTCTLILGDPLHTTSSYSPCTLILGDPPKSHVLVCHLHIDPQEPITCHVFVWLVYSDLPTFRMRLLYCEYRLLQAERMVACSLHLRSDPPEPVTCETCAVSSACFHPGRMLACSLHSCMTHHLPVATVVALVTCFYADRSCVPTGGPYCPAGGPCGSCWRALFSCWRTLFHFACYV